MKSKTAIATQAGPFTLEEQKILSAWVAYYPYPMMGLIEALRSVQDWHRCIRPEDEAYVAKLFSTTPAHVHEVATFFPYFTRRPTGKKRLGLCHGISCALAGADGMLACLEKTLGVPEGRATPDGEFSFEAMECLGACDHAPALIVNEELQGAATESLIKRLAGGRG